MCLIKNLKVENFVVNSGQPGNLIIFGSFQAPNDFFGDIWRSIDRGYRLDTYSEHTSASKTRVQEQVAAPCLFELNEKTLSKHMLSKEFFEMEPTRWIDNLRKLKKL